MTENIFVDKDGTEYKELKLQELNTQYEGKKTLMKLITTGSSEIEHYSTFIVTSCPKCHDEQQVSIEDFPNWRDMKPVTKCDHCALPMYEKQNNKSELRKILLSEQGVTNPIHITGYVYGDDVHRVNPGIKMNVMGTLRSLKRRPNDLTYMRIYDINRLTLSDDKPILPTSDEMEYFKGMDKSLLVQSFAPHIRNMNLIKEGLLLCCIGGVETSDSRGDINALLLGDPGVAKTQLLKFITHIIPKSDYASGKSASGAGLFGGVDNLADGTRIGKPGTVVMCNGGVACIDEMEKMNANDRTYAHEVMESQTFSLRKIGIPITWEVKVSIIGAANPKKSRWNPELSIKENVNMPDSLLSRFGLIFLIRDIPNKTEDLAIAEHIMRARRGQLEKPLQPEMLTKFINYAKTFKPVINSDAESLLVNWWTELRDEKQKEESISVDIRTYEDLCRLTEAYARLDLVEEANITHAKKAIKMLNDSLHTLGMNTPGEKNASINEHFDKKGYISFVFSHPINRAMAVAKLCEKYKWFPTESSAEREIEKLIAWGNITESGGVLEWVS